MQYCTVIYHTTGPYKINYSTLKLFVWRKIEWEKKWWPGPEIYTLNTDTDYFTFKNDLGKVQISLVSSTSAWTHSESEKATGESV